MSWYASYGLTPPSRTRRSFSTRPTTTNREAQALARACGVTSVLTKPCEPEVVLRTVEAALGITAPPAAPSPSEEFDREHLRLLTDKLSQKGGRDAA